MGFGHTTQRANRRAKSVVVRVVYVLILTDRCCVVTNACMPLVRNWNIRLGPCRSKWKTKSDETECYHKIRPGGWGWMGGGLEKLNTVGELRIVRD